MKQNLDEYFADKEEELVEAVSRLVRIPSVGGAPQAGKPFGAEPARALEEALAMAREMGLAAESLEGYVGVVDLNEQETELDILAHLDVVDAGPGWTVTEAFTPKLMDGLLYGRGTDDDKGPLVAVLFAMKAIRDLGLPLRKNARLILGTDEESGFADIHWYYARHPYAPYTFSPDAAFPLTNVEKGHYQPTFRQTWTAESVSPRVVLLSGGTRINVVPAEAEAVICGLAEAALRPICSDCAARLGVSFALYTEERGVRIVCKGQNAHASTPEEGNNALTALVHLLSELPLADCTATRAVAALQQMLPHGDCSAQALGMAQSDLLSGELTLAFSVLHLDDSGLEGRFDCRTPLCTTEQSCKSVAEAAFAAHGLRLEGEIDPAHHTPADSPFVQTLLRCYEQYTGQEGQCLSTGGGTYVHGIPGAVAFGASMPGFASGLHGPDERVNVADLLTACKIFTQAILDLCG